LITSRDAITLKAAVLAGTRDILRAEGFVEVTTPVMRRADLGAGRRLKVVAGQGHQLRSMIGPALRMNLEHHPRVFEIGPCFRPDKRDPLHATEFTMLDLYAAGESFDFLFTLAERLVAPHIPHKPTRISVAEHINTVFGIDLRTSPVAELPQRIAGRLGLPTEATLRDVLGPFIETELEPRTAGTAAFLTDFPLGGDEPCARLKPGTTAVLNQFELIVDGIEVVNGYEDEPDGAAFTVRAKAVGLYDDEQRLTREAIDAGRVPAASVGLGIGIERLCAASAGTRDIHPFRQSTQF
jgi:elongation factor P--beta-lysine ligase